MNVFVCTKDTCPNKDIEYFFPVEVKKCECGGCHKVLKVVRTDIIEVPVVAE